MNLDPIQQYQADVTRLTIFWSAIEFVVFIVAMWVLYFVIKAAVREGIKEAVRDGNNTSNLGDSWASTVIAARNSEADTKHLPEMRAER